MAPIDIPSFKLSFKNAMLPMGTRSNAPMSFSRSIVLVACTAALAQSAAAIPATYNFVHRGFSSHAYVFGSFTGDDLNHDGQIVSYQGEVFAINATYTGSDAVARFTIVNNNPTGSELVYTLGSRWIGDDSGRDSGGQQEFIWFGQGAFFSGGYHQYLTGYYVEENFCRLGDFMCGEVDYFFDGAFLASDTTTQYARISGSVPEPQTWVLLVAGFGLTGAALRRRTRRALTGPGAQGS
ncbi:MAG: PEPxxWA-CTERM sorting domain-containing protein [Polymorphobacter sp.]